MSATLPPELSLQPTLFTACPTTLADPLLMQMFWSPQGEVPWACLFAGLGRSGWVPAKRRKSRSVEHWSHVMLDGQSRECHVATMSDASAFEKSMLWPHGGWLRFAQRPEWSARVAQSSP